VDKLAVLKMKLQIIYKHLPVIQKNPPEAGYGFKNCLQEMKKW
jgi:hypothetical protein